MSRKNSIFRVLSQWFLNGYNLFGDYFIWIVPRFVVGINILENSVGLNVSTFHNYQTFTTWFGCHRKESSKYIHFVHVHSVITKKNQSSPYNKAPWWVSVRVPDRLTCIWQDVPGTAFWHDGSCRDVKGKLALTTWQHCWLSGGNILIIKFSFQANHACPHCRSVDPLSLPWTLYKA